MLSLNVEPAHGNGGLDSASREFKSAEKRS